MQTNKISLGSRFKKLTQETIITAVTSMHGNQWGTYAEIIQGKLLKYSKGQLVLP